MGKKLAIKGDKERGNEVIALLEMLGGDNRWKASGNIEKVYYSISNGGILYSPQLEKNTVVFALKEFLKKYPFKVGDVIKFPNNMAEEIAEMKWDEELEDIIYTSVSGWTRPCHVPKNTNNKTNMKTDCKKCGLHFGSVRCFDKDCPNNTPKNLEENKFPPFEPMFKINDELEYMVPDGYEITEVSKDKVFIKPIKPKYPTTYEECYDEDNTELHFIYVDENERDLYESFIQLIRCRNAYWKIAGEEMGLGKPWEPDWSIENEIKYVIEVYHNNIRKNSQGYSNTLLAFPTIEMRDAFYENFKDLIEQCKELL